MADFGINALAYGSAKISNADLISLSPENTWTTVDGAGFTVSNDGRSLVIILNEIPTARPFIQISNVDRMEVVGIHYNNGQFTIDVTVSDTNSWASLVNSDSAAALHFLIYEPAEPAGTTTEELNEEILLMKATIDSLQDQINNTVPGVGDLCSLLSADSGYQMFRNGLTIQWMSSEALTAENSLSIDFPIPFSTKPFKVVASTRFPEGDSSSEQWIQVVDSTKDSVTILAQSQNSNSWQKSLHADIIAIGIAEVTNCPNSEGSAGTKISNLKKAASLEDSDLFVISKEIDGDSTYDTSNNVTLSSLSENIKTRMGPTLSTSSIISWTKGESNRYLQGQAGFSGDALPDGTWVLLYFPWYAYDGNSEDDNAWFHNAPLIREEAKGFNVRAWMIELGNGSHLGGNNYTGHGIGFKISEDPV